MNLIKAIDVASYQPADLTDLIQTYQAQHVIVRLYLPGERISQDHSKAQIRSALENGCSVGGYFWCYSSFDPKESVRQAIVLAKGEGIDLRVLWHDCEPYYGANGAIIDPGPDAEWLRESGQVCDELGIKKGIYTGRYYWRDRIGNGEDFSDWWLWAADYNRMPNLDSVPPFSGFTRTVGHQYTSSGVDRSVFLEEILEEVNNMNQTQITEANAIADILYNYDDDDAGIAGLMNRIHWAFDSTGWGYADTGFKRVREDLQGLADRIRNLQNLR